MTFYLAVKCTCDFEETREPAKIYEKERDVKNYCKKKNRHVEDTGSYYNYYFYDGAQFHYFDVAGRG